MKFLENKLKKEKDKMKVPKSVQDAIPIKGLYSDGIFYLENNKYSKTYRFSDVNYAIANNEDKENMFLKYSELLNSLDSGAENKITIVNRRINKTNFEKEMLLKDAKDNLDVYRKEYNEILLNKAETSNKIIQEKYITTTVEKKNVFDARTYFTRVGNEYSKHLSELKSKCVELDCNERLRLFHDFYRTSEESNFVFDIKNNMRKGHDFKDYISPDSFEIKRDYIKIGERYARVLFLKEYASYISDNMITELTNLNKNLMLSIDILSVPMDEAVREAENRRLGVETNITQWQRRQNNNNNFSAVIPYDLEIQRQESKTFLDDLISRDQRMFLCVMTLVHTAESKEELDNDTEVLLSVGKKHMCQLAILKYQQLEGLNTVLPIGHRKINALRTLTTESLAVFMPFRVQEINDKEGIYYGQNTISKNMIVADRKRLLNGNSFILGVSGSGKSFTAKQEEKEAKEIALAIELFTDGSLNTFAKHTNVNTENRLICYDILELGKQLQPIGMLVILDSILNRITVNRAKGKNTYIFIDEIYLLFQQEYSANFLFTLWKRVRKYGAFCTRYNSKL